MKGIAIWLAAALVAVAVSPRPAGAQTETETTVTAGTAAVFPSGSRFNGVPLEGLRFGVGVTISSTGSAEGQLQTTLLGTSALGQPQSIEIEGKASSGSAVVAGTVTLSGSCSIDMGDGTLPLQNVPFAVTVTSDGAGQGTLGLVLGATSLPAATVNIGSMTIE
jgi:hypothetical protein